jgi:hypothetical protein
MKNIHILPTDNKLSRLYFNINDKQFQICEIEKPSTILKPNRHIYITSEEEIKEGDWFMSDYNSFPMHNIKELSEREGILGWKQEDLKNNLKIILTTDQDLIKDGVQAIDDKFLEWFVKNPSCEVFETKKGYKNAHSSSTISEFYKIFIPKEEPKQEILKEVITAEEFFRKKIKELNPFISVTNLSTELISAEEGMRWAKEYADYVTLKQENKSC